jgi:hypothetical protein
LVVVAAGRGEYACAGPVGVCAIREEVERLSLSLKYRENPVSASAESKDEGRWSEAPIAVA